MQRLQLETTWYSAWPLTSVGSNDRPNCLIARSLRVNGLLFEIWDGRPQQVGGGLFVITGHRSTFHLIIYESTLYECIFTSVGHKDINICFTLKNVIVVTLKYCYPALIKIVQYNENVLFNDIRLNIFLCNAFKLDLIVLIHWCLSIDLSCIYLSILRKTWYKINVKKRLKNKKKKHVAQA